MASPDLEAELERARAVLADFASAANHDLNAPLRHIHMFAELIRRDHGNELPDGAIGYLDRILESVDRSERLVAGLVDYARLASTPPRSEPVNLTEVAMKAAEAFQPRFAEAGGTLEIAPLPAVRGDAAMLGRVFAALFDNALKYRAHCLPVMHVSEVEAPDGFVGIRAVDQGPGLPAAHSDAAFELLRRLTGANEVEGEGLGLAVAKLVVETHGGTIAHDSGHTLGAAFTITLPAAD